MGQLVVGRGSGGSLFSVGQGGSWVKGGGSWVTHWGGFTHSWVGSLKKLLVRFTQYIFHDIKRALENAAS